MAVVLERNRYYNFSTISPIIGAEYNRMLLDSILSYRSAIKYINVKQTQAALYPSIECKDMPEEEYNYYLFRNGDDEVVLADAWIITDSIVEVKLQSAFITIDEIDNESLVTVRSVLTALGLYFTLTTQNTQQPTV
jgi:hypothetical protein